MRLAMVTCAAMLACGSAGAQTVYSDQASWAASLPADSIVPLTDTLSGIAYETSIVIDGDGDGRFSIGAPVPVAFTVGGGFGAEMDFGSPCENDAGCVITAPLEIDISLPESVDGVFADVFAVWFDAGITLNGVPLPLSHSDFVPWGFAGGGPITELDFVSESGFTDDQTTFFFENIVVAVPRPAAVPEPSDGLLIPAMLLGLALCRSATRLG